MAYESHYTCEEHDKDGLYYNRNGSRHYVNGWQSVGWRSQLKKGDKVDVYYHDRGIDEYKVVVNGRVVFDRDRGDKTAMQLIKERTAAIKKEKFGL